MTMTNQRLTARDDRIRRHLDPALETVLPDLTKCLHTLALAMRGAIESSASGC